MLARRTLTSALVFSGLLLTVVGITAQEIPDALTLSAAVDLALRNNPAIREARAGSAAANADVDVARLAYLPRLDLLWQVNRATRNNVFGLLLPQPIIPSVSGPVLGTESLNGVWSAAGGLLLSWEAVDFGRRGAAIDVARAESDVADARRLTTELDVATAAADAYLAVVAADAASEAARANVERLDTFAATVRALVQSQLRAGAEQSRAEAELAAARNRLTEATRDGALARLALAEVLGAPTARLTLAPEGLRRTPERSATGPFDPKAHPRAVAADAQADAVRARDRSLDRSYFPRIDLQTAFSARGVSRRVDGSPNGTGLGLDVPNWGAGVSVTFPSFELFRLQARRQVEIERLGEATAHFDRTVQQLQTQEARARTVAAAAYEIAANIPAQLQAARDANTQARARYDAGLTNVLEVAEAQRLLAEAEADNAVASLAVWRALLAEAALRGDLQAFLARVRTSETADTTIR